MRTDRPIALSPFGSWLFVVVGVILSGLFRTEDDVSPEQLFLFELQLQHDGVELHVEIIGPLQLSLVVFSDVQRVPVNTSPAQQHVHCSVSSPLILIIPLLCE